MVFGEVSPVNIRSDAKRQYFKDAVNSKDDLDEIVEPVQHGIRFHRRVSLDADENAGKDNA